MQHGLPDCGCNTPMLLLSEEERCALVDIVRFGSTDAVAPSLRERLLLHFSQAAVLALYGKDQRPKPEDIADGYLPEVDPSDGQLAIRFIPLLALQDAPATLCKSSEI